MNLENAYQHIDYLVDRDNTYFNQANMYKKLSNYRQNLVYT